MALFQPTNIFPSSLGGIGHGTVDITEGLSVLWQVNGSSAMTAFSITIYKNDPSSTQLYTTGKRTDECPFYGTDFTGNVQFFNFLIPTSALVTAGLSNGNEYKLIIEQWWSETNSIKQTSASVFVARSAPTIDISNLPHSLDQMRYSFTGAYTQAQGATLNWFRWMISVAGNTDEYLLDTGNISGSSDIRVVYDGFFPGQQYMVRCIVQTEHGVEADTGWEIFDVDYPVSPISGLLDVQNTPYGVRLSWPFLAYIPGVPTGDYSIGGNGLQLSVGASVRWSTANGRSLNFVPSYSVVWRGRAASGEVWRLSGEGRRMSLFLSGGRLELRLDGTVLFSHDFATTGYIIGWTVCLTPTKIYIKIIESRLDGLYPSSALYPTSTLYPMSETMVETTFSADLIYNQFKAESVELLGEQFCEFQWLSRGELSQSVIDDIMHLDWLVPERDGNTYFLADFKDGLNAGNIAGGALTQGVSVYRQNGDEPTIHRIADVDGQVTELLDLGVANQQPYTYYLFAKGESTFLSAPLTSPPVTPMCWVLAVMECKPDGASWFRPVDYFRFGHNVTGGSVSNNNSPEFFENFTRYPLTQAKSRNNKSGVLTSLIGSVKNGQYSDTVELQDKIFALSVTGNAIFIKNRKGELIRAKTAAPITMTPMDNTQEQALNMALPWQETGSAQNVSIVSTPLDTFWPFGRG